MRKGEIPDIEFNGNASGLTVYSPSYLLTPRFVPWDLPGRCSRCKSSTVEIDYVIQELGVSLFCSRLKGGERFIAFDKPALFGEKAFVRLRARNKVLNLPLYRPELGHVDAMNIPSSVPATVDMKPLDEGIETGEIPTNNH